MRARTSLTRFATLCLVAQVALAACASVVPATVSTDPASPEPSGPSAPLVASTATTATTPTPTSTSTRTEAAPPDSAAELSPAADTTTPEPPTAAPTAVPTRPPNPTPAPPLATAGSLPRSTAAPAAGTPRVIGPGQGYRPGGGPVSARSAQPSIAPIRTGAVPCTTFPATNVWNIPVDGLRVASNSATMVNAIGAGNYLHADFDAIGDGIPYNVVTASTPAYNVAFDYADESDPGPYPIPSNPKIEGGSDRHLLSIDLQRCKLWELYAVYQSGGGWTAGSGAVFDLRSNALRPAGWTSADAAGLPIYPGLVRYDEVVSGAINHALRFTAPDTCGYIYPATHLTAAPCSNLPPMGLRVRLKASVDISSFGPNAQVVLRAMKKYGLILADNGSPWYVSGIPDTRWNDDEFHRFQTLHGSDFEVVDTSGLRNG